MKLNLDYYKESEENKLTESEEQIICKFFKEENINLDEVLNNDSSFDEIKVASDNRKNIISFYPINSEETVLEIGANFGEITGELCKKAKKVVAVEAKKEKAEAITKRYNDIQNLEVFAGEFKNIKFEEKFDYVVLMGVLEDSKENIEKIIKQVKLNLKIDGKLLIAINNKFGIKYWAGVKREESEKAYNTIIGNTDITELAEIQKILRENSFQTKVYYPMPDYTFTNAIYTDEFLPDVEHVSARDYVYFDEKINDVKFSERDALKEILKNNKDIFKFLANSYFIVANKTKENIGIKAVTYGLLRKPEYRIKTIIKEKEVVKTANNEKANSHIERIKENIEILEKANVKTLDRYENNSIVSKFVENGLTLDKCIINLLKDNKKEEALNKIEDFKNEVLLKFETPKNLNNNVFAKYNIKYNAKELKELHFIKCGLIDLIFQNCFIIKNDFYVYDQEWMEPCTPIEYILYRAIIYLPELKDYIKIEDVFEKFNITKYIEIFEELDKKMQLNLRDEIFWNMHVKSINSILENNRKDAEKEAEEIKIKQLEKIVFDKEVHIRNLESKIISCNSEIENYANQLRVISNSLSWKITKPFRYLSWMLNPKSNAKLIDRILPPGSRKRIKYDEKLAKKLWEEKIEGYRKATDEAGVEYWKGIEHRERLKLERDVEREAKGEFSDYEYWMKENDPTTEELELQKKHKFKRKPKISIVIPLYNTPEDLFRELLFNMYRQTYTNWELCLADGSNSRLEYIESMCKDSRIHYKFLGENKGISGNSNEGLKMVTGDYVALLDHDDLLMPNALYEIVKVINENPNVRFIYTDEDKMTTIDLPRFDAHFKPDFSPDYLNGNNYICHFSVFKKEVMDKLEGFRDEYNGAQDMDIILRTTEIVKPEEIYHIPKILYHWRICETSTAGNPETKLYAYESGKKAVQDHINRLGLKGIVERDENMYGIYRVKYEIIGNPKVNILIPNKNNVENLKKCIESIIQKTKYKNYEIDIIDDNSNISEVQNYYNELEKNKNIKILKYKQEKSNYAKLINYGVKNTKGQFIIQLNNTSTIITEDWVETLIGYAQRKDIGVVSGKVFAEDDTILHSGIIVAGENGEIKLNKGLEKDRFGYFAKECHVQNYSAVGTNTMICKRENFEKVNGLNENLSNFEEVDFCLSLRKLGLLNVYMPYVQVYDSLEENENEKHDEDLKFIKDKWSEIYVKGDKYYNPNFRIDSDNFKLKKEKVN